MKVTRAILLAAMLTGVFCSVFTVVVDQVIDALSSQVAIGLSFVSGFLGSLFAQMVLRRKETS